MTDQGRREWTNCGMRRGSPAPRVTSRKASEQAAKPQQQPAVDQQTGDPEAGRIEVRAKLHKGFGINHFGVLHGGVELAWEYLHQQARR